MADNDRFIEYSERTPNVPIGGTPNRIVEQTVMTLCIAMTFEALHACSDFLRSINYIDYLRIKPARVRSI